MPTPPNEPKGDRKEPLERIADALEWLCNYAQWIPAFLFLIAMGSLGSCAFHH